MGWNNGTIIFDGMCKALLCDKLEDKKEILKKLITILDDMDWDGQNESDYWTHPIVKEAMKELHQEWFNDRQSVPPCSECGAETPEQAETMCICSGDKDHCHGCELWHKD